MYNVNTGKQPEMFQKKIKWNNVKLKINGE